MAIGSDLAMPNVLDRIVGQSCELTGAQYGVLGVVGAAGELANVVGGRPGQPARNSYFDDFPELRPSTPDLLSVPIRVRESLYGLLYLADKAEGQHFTERDLHQVQELTRAAGVVIQNGHDLMNSERERVWLEASAELFDVLSPGRPVAEAMRHVIATTCAVSKSRAVGLLRAVRDEDEPELAAQGGPDAAALPRLWGEPRGQLRGEIRSAFRSVEPTRVAIDRRRVALLVPLPTRLIGPAALVVLIDIRDDRSADQVPEDGLITRFAQQAGHALDGAQALADRAELAIISDRVRIARDLHDLVIQRLFATGLQLQSAQTRTQDPKVQDALGQAVEELDATIQEIRSTIFELHHRTGSFRQRVRELVDGYSPVLGFHPGLRMNGPIDTLVTAPYADHAMAVIREGLSNVSRHADATSVSIGITATTRGLRVEIVDNGVGVPDIHTESGLRNLRGRATTLGGDLAITARTPQGTRLDWQIPIS